MRKALGRQPSPQAEFMSGLCAPPTQNGSQAAIAAAFGYVLILPDDECCVSTEYDADPPPLAPDEGARMDFLRRYDDQGELIRNVGLWTDVKSSSGRRYIADGAAYRNITGPD